jgi:chromosome partitioning protein
MENKVITISHQKGGVGKSTVALNLAVELSKEYNVAVVDLDHQRSMTIFQSIRDGRGLEKLEVIVVEDENELMHVMNTYDGILIIDSGGFDSDLNRIAMLGSDMIVTPVSNSLIELYGLEKFKLIIEELKEIQSKIKAHILLNNISPTATTLVDDLKNFLTTDSEKFQVIKGIMRQRIDYRKSFEYGQSVVEMDPQSKAAEEIKNIVSNIKEQLGIK